PPQAGGVAKVPEAAGAEVIEFRGYAYTREPSSISGDLVTVYDPTTPQIWKVPYRSKVEPTLVVRAPLGGYVIPAAFAREIGGKLANHGISFEPIPDDVYSVRAEVFRATQVTFSTTPFEGRMRANFAGEWIR